MACPRVSVVLPVYNSEMDVSSAIGAIEKQTFHDKELIVVDDGSSDGTYSETERCAHGKPGIRVIRTPHLGPSHARNAGLAAATGEIIVFVEADCAYDDSYLSKAVAQLEADPSASAVCLTGAPLIMRTTLATVCIDIENKIQHKLLREGKIKPFYAWVFRRHVLVNLGGFDERLFQAEDRDLFRRMEKAGYKIALVPGINWQHRRDQTTPELAKKWFLRGRMRVLYTMKHGLAYELLRTMLPLWATATGLVLLAFSPWVALGILLVVAAAFIASSVRVAAISWNLVEKKRIFLGYPIFALVRSFSTAMGYTTALPAILFKMAKGEELSWRGV